MIDPIHLSTRDDVEAALMADALVPPHAPTSLRAGPTAYLRDAMARFSAPGLHARRRNEVVEAIEQLDLAAVAAVAQQRTRKRLTGGPIEAVADIAYTVPTESLGHMLGVPTDESPRSSTRRF